MVKIIDRILVRISDKTQQQVELLSKLGYSKTEIVNQGIELFH